MLTETHPEVRLPFDTHFEFTVTKLKQVARAVQEVGRDQVELCCKTDRGLRAFVYGKSGKIVLYSRYNYRKQPKPIRLGELGLISLDQARQKHREIRLAADQGTDPKAPKKTPLTFAELHHQHYVVECQSRQKKTLHTDQSRYDHWLGPEFGHLPLTEITPTLVSKFVIKMQDAKLAPATIKKIIVQLRSCLSLAVDLDFIPKNVAKRIRLPKVNNRRTAFLTVEPPNGRLSPSQTIWTRLQRKKQTSEVGQRGRSTMMPNRTSRFGPVAGPMSSTTREQSCGLLINNSRTKRIGRVRKNIS